MKQKNRTKTKPPTKTTKNHNPPKIKNYISNNESVSSDINKYNKILEENAVKLETLESEGRRNHSREEILKKYNNVQKLDRDIMDTLVEYIEIGRCEKKVHRNDLPPIIIHWKF